MRGLKKLASGLFPESWSVDRTTETAAAVGAETDQKEYVPQLPGVT